MIGRQDPTASLATFVSVVAALCVILVRSTVMASEGFKDTFAGATLDAAWQEKGIDGGTHLQSVMPLRGELRVTGITHTGPETRSVWYSLERPCSTLKGDFTATMELDWQQDGVQSMGMAMLEVIGESGKTLARAGGHDVWPYAMVSAVSGIRMPGVNEDAVVNEAEACPLPERGTGLFSIHRVGDEYSLSVQPVGDDPTVKLLGPMLLNRGQGLTEDVAALRLVFTFHDSPTASFGSFGVREVSVMPGAPAPRRARRVAPPKPWQVGKPIATYWAGPPMTDAVAQQMAEAGFNLVWCTNPWDLCTVHRHGLRGIIYLRGGLSDPRQQAILDGFIASVKGHPALYAYHLADEPMPPAFAGLAKLKDYLQEKDPSHLSYVNLYPVSPECCGEVEEQVIPVYRQYLASFAEVFKPQLLSYDHYNFWAEDGRGDGPTYFLNQALIREAALKAGIPALNIVQGCSWRPDFRIPNEGELRWLVYTSLAYGFQGISYYVYQHPQHLGAMLDPVTGVPNPSYHAVKQLNPEFVAIATELQPLHSLAVYHTGMIPKGGVALPSEAPFRLEPALRNEDMPFKSVFWFNFNREPMASGLLLGYFGKQGSPSHAVVVNLNHKNAVSKTIMGPSTLELFDAKTRRWSRAASNRERVKLPPGGGVLVRWR